VGGGTSSFQLSIIPASLTILEINFQAFGLHFLPQAAPFPLLVLHQIYSAFTQ